MTSGLGGHQPDALPTPSRWHATLSDSSGVLPGFTKCLGRPEKMEMRDISIVSNAADFQGHSSAS